MSVCVCVCVYIVYSIIQVLIRWVAGSLVGTSRYGYVVVGGGVE